MRDDWQHNLSIGNSRFRQVLSLWAVSLVVLCCSCQPTVKHTDVSSANKIRVVIEGWVQRSGVYYLDSNATLATANAACGGWKVRSDVERLRAVRITRRSNGQTNELRFRIRDVAPDTIQLRDGDRLGYSAVLW